MKHFTIKGLLILLLFITASACQKSIIEDVTPLHSKHELTIRDAREWFQNAIDKSPNSKKSQNPLEKLTFWEYAKNFEVGGQSIVMLPIQYKDYLYISKSVNQSATDSTMGLLDFETYTTMFYMMKRDNNGNVKGSFLKYIADKDYLIRNNYKKLDNSFTGTLIMSDWDENINEIYFINNGKISVTRTSSNGRAAYGCVTYSIDYYSVACAYGSCGDPQYIQTISHMICSDGSLVNPDAFNYTTVAFGGISGPSYDYVLNQADVQAWLFGPDMYPDERTYYITHPWLILPALRNKRDAEQATQTRYNTNNDDINANAFKHAFWSALNTITWDDGVATFMGNLHEASGPGTPNQHNMDAFNNRLGIGIAMQLRNQISDPKDLKIAVREGVSDAIDDGRGVRIVGGQLVPTDSSGH